MEDMRTSKGHLYQLLQKSPGRDRHRLLRSRKQRFTMAQGSLAQEQQRINLADLFQNQAIRKVSGKGSLECMSRHNPQSSQSPNGDEMYNLLGRSLFDKPTTAKEQIQYRQGNKVTSNYPPNKGRGSVLRHSHLQQSSTHPKLRRSELSPTNYWNFSLLRNEYLVGTTQKLRPRWQKRLSHCR